MANKKAVTVGTQFKVISCLLIIICLVFILFSLILLDYKECKRFLLFYCFVNM